MKLQRITKDFTPNEVLNCGTKTHNNNMSRNYNICAIQASTIMPMYRGRSI